MKLTNRFYELELNEKNGSICSLKNTKGKEFICCNEQRNLVTLHMLDESGAKQLLQSNDAIFSYKSADGDITVLHYEKVGGMDIEVTAKVRCPQDEPMTYWSMNVKNHSDLHLDKIDFPKVVVPNDLVATGGTGRIFTSMMEGVVIEDVEIREHSWLHYRDIGYPVWGWEGLYPGACPTQFQAYYCDEGGLYFAAHDPYCNPKSIEFCKEDGGIKLEFQLFPGQDDTTDFSYEYEMVLGVFEGDWYDAADIYRNFIESSGLVTLPKLKDNKDIPEWLEKTPIIVCYPVRGEVDSRFEETTEYYPYTKATDIMKGLSEDLKSPVMPLLMHWEGTAPWAPPYVWPPYGDFEDFKQYIKDMHDSGNYIGVYCSGSAWTQYSLLLPSYNKEKQFEEEHLANIMMVGPTQELEYTNICAGAIRRGYNMCPSCKKTREIVVEEFRKIVDNCDVDYVQFFDQDLGGGTYSCYSRKHDHSFGPGKWKNEAMLAIANRMYEAADEAGRKGKVLIGCEANAAEPFVNRFIFNDSRHNINYNIGNPVPAYNYIFHEYVNNFMGNQNSSYGIVDFQKYPENVYYRYAHAFVQGDVMTIVLKDKGKIHWDWCTPWSEPEIDQEEIKAYIREMNQWRKYVAKPSLQFGKMVKPMAYDCGIYNEEIRFYGEHNYPSVESARYITPEGKAQQIFVNFLPYEQTIVLHNDGSKLTLVKDYMGRETEALSGTEISLTLPARSVRMVEQAC